MSRSRPISVNKVLKKNIYPKWYTNIVDAAWKSYRDGVYEDLRKMVVENIEKSK